MKILEAGRYKEEFGQDLPRWKEELLKYEQEGGYFVTFGTIPKLGLNPVNEYGTPLGIYSYLLDRTKLSPFALNRPYAIVFKPKPEANLLYLNNYSKGDLKRDISKLIEMGFDQETIDNAQKQAWVPTPGGKLWNITRVLSGDKSDVDSPSNVQDTSLEGFVFEVSTLLETFTKLRRQQINKRFNSLLDPRNQNYTTLKSRILTYQREFNREEKQYLNSKGLTMYSLVRPDDISDMVSKFYDYKAASRSDLKKYLASLLPFEKQLLKQQLRLPKTRDPSVTAGNYTFKWNKLFRMLGYDGAIDDCQKIIHENEPCQAVFFSPSKLELVKIITKSETTESQEQSDENFAQSLFSNTSFNLLKNLESYKASPKLLSQYVTDPDPKIAKAAIKNPRTPPAALLLAAETIEPNSPNIEHLLASINLPPKALLNLVNKIDSFSDLTITNILDNGVFTTYENPEISAEILDILYEKNPDNNRLFSEIAGNPNTDEQTLLKILNREDNSYFIDKILNRRNLTKRVIEEAVEKINAGYVSTNILFNLLSHISSTSNSKELTLKLIKKLFANQFTVNYISRETYAVLKYINTSSTIYGDLEEILTQLSKDENDHIANIANRYLEEFKKESMFESVVAKKIFSKLLRLH